MTDPDLVQRCKELLDWSKTGLLNGGSGGAVRALADKLEERIGPHYALSVAETQTKDDAMREVVRLASQSSRIEELEKALGEARAALKCSYDVIEFPANGCTAQDTAIRTIDAVISMPSANRGSGEV